MSATKHIKLFDMSRAAELIDDNPDTPVLMEHYIFEAMSSASRWSAGDMLKPWTPTAEMLVPAALKRGTEALHERTVSGAVQGYDWIQVLKPDQRLHRDELARWCAVMGLESDEFVLPAPVVEPIGGVETREMAECLGGLPFQGWLDQDQLHRALKNYRGWVIDACLVRGEAGKTTGIWNPVQIAKALNAKDRVVYSIARLRDQFEQQPALKKWLAEFESLAESLEFGL